MFRRRGPKCPLLLLHAVLRLPTLNPQKARLPSLRHTSRSSPSPSSAGRAVTISASGKIGERLLLPHTMKSSSSGISGGQSLPSCSPTSGTCEQCRNSGLCSARSSARCWTMSLAWFVNSLPSSTPRRPRARPAGSWSYDSSGMKNLQIFENLASWGCTTMSPHSCCWEHAA